MSKSNWELASLSILDVIITSGVSNRVITLKKLHQLNFLLSRQKRHCHEVIVSWKLNPDIILFSVQVTQFYFQICHAWRRVQVYQIFLIFLLFFGVTIIIFYQ